MAKNLIITGNNPMDEVSRFEALQKLQLEATTTELIKLKKAIDDPQLRNMLKMI